MGRFAEGDKVISVKDTQDTPEGFIGFVVDATDPDFEYTVVNKLGRAELFHEHELELLGVSNNTVKTEILDGVTGEEYTGGSSSYYKIDVVNPTTSEAPYQAECNDIIEALGLTFTEGNIFKAIWRIAADRNGKKKKGNNSVYDAEKVVFFAERLLIQEKSKEK